MSNSIRVIKDMSMVHVYLPDIAAFHDPEYAERFFTAYLQAITQNCGCKVLIDLSQSFIVTEAMSLRYVVENFFSPDVQELSRRCVSSATVFVSNVIISSMLSFIVTYDTDPRAVPTTVTCIEETCREAMGASLDSIYSGNAEEFPSQT
jgi:hypothetical protein